MHNLIYRLNILASLVLFIGAASNSSDAFAFKGDKDREVSLTLSKSGVEKFKSLFKHKVKHRGEIAFDAFNGNQYTFKNGKPGFRLRLKDKKKDNYTFQMKTTREKRTLKCKDLSLSFSRSEAVSHSVPRSQGDRLLKESQNFQKRLFNSSGLSKSSEQIGKLVENLPSKEFKEIIKAKKKSDYWVNTKILEDIKYVAKVKGPDGKKVKIAATESGRVFPNGKTLVKYDIEFEVGDKSKLSDDELVNFACKTILGMKINKTDLPKVPSKDPVKQLLRDQHKK
ncbi:hypothetical protein N9W79_01075 [bacterium]|nr:hypothetical protein [bacterium]